MRTASAPSTASHTFQPGCRSMARRNCSRRKALSSAIRICFVMTLRLLPLPKNLATTQGRGVSGKQGMSDSSISAILYTVNRGWRDADRTAPETAALQRRFSRRLKPGISLCHLMASHPFDSAQGRLFAQKAREEWATPCVVVQVSLVVPARSRAGPPRQTNF